ncbi:hypothetical protein HAX54_007645 [Datura stramonium]|uniref:Uncharacterized protein n=1 Tax=Datura stramonium TaxID=4076 RepID=A0ABS8TC43_DATST|nr:hypothetical protein [Datura stramonium]
MSSLSRPAFSSLFLQINLGFVGFGPMNQGHPIMPRSVPSRGLGKLSAAPSWCPCRLDAFQRTRRLERALAYCPGLHFPLESALLFFLPFPDALWSKERHIVIILSPGQGTLLPRTFIMMWEENSRLNSLTLTKYFHSFAICVPRGRARSKIQVTARLDGNVSA